MKFQLVIFLIIAFGIACRHTPGSILKETPSQIRKIIDTSGIDYNNLTNQDRGKYILNVEVVNEGNDSCNGSVRRFYKLLAILQNRSEDTLKYLDFTCSHMIWYTDSNLVWANEQDSSCIVCDNNFVTDFSIPPHGSKKIELLAKFFNEIKPVTTQFRVGMVLQRVIKASDWKFYFKRFVTGEMGNLHHQTKNLIWSNVVQISI